MRTPEIHYGTNFGKYIVGLIGNNKSIKRVVEIGSGSGNGSTQCLAAALEVHKTEDTKLICMEPTKYFEDLKKNTEHFSFVECYDKTSISYDSFSLKNYDDYIQYCIEHKDHLNSLKGRELESIQDELLGRVNWYNEDMIHFKASSSGVLEDLTEDYDLCLIDGSEFSGYDEFLLIKDKVKIILLDDDNEYKNHKTKRHLRDDGGWVCVAEDDERNGWSSWVRIR
jgi:hypothetical protein